MQGPVCFCYSTFNMIMFSIIAACTFGLVLLCAGLLHLFPKLGSPGKAVAAWCCRAPGLDIVVTTFTILPLILGPVIDGWLGLLAACIGQALALQLWCWLHELANLSAIRGPRIVSVLNSKIGRFRNHACLWSMTPAVPVFWIVRMAEIFLWPVISGFGRLPRYNHAEWVNCSRQKFEGLVGHDLIWCLYCDWMTGIWSLGTEMLRNIESFYCPIRFYHGKKCENCKIDFPDVDNGWVPADGTMADVVRVLDEKYDGKLNGWFGHPHRTVPLSINGQPPASVVSDKP